MKIQNPFYLSLAVAAVLFLGTANHLGWSVVQTLASHTWQRTDPNTQHK